MIRVGDPAPPFTGEAVCPEVSPGFISLGCTEPRGHEGPHVACGTHTVLEVWED